jgi:NADH dehydrogenase
MDAVGPEALRFDELLRLVRRTVGSRAALVPMPAAVVLATARLVGALVRDVVLTPDEVAGLSGNLLVSKGPPTAPTRFTEWLADHASELGHAWASELGRHYR